MKIWTSVWKNVSGTSIRFQKNKKQDISWDWASADEYHKSHDLWKNAVFCFFIVPMHQTRFFKHWFSFFGGGGDFADVFNLYLARCCLWACSCLVLAPYKGMDRGIIGRMPRGARVKEWKETPWEEGVEDHNLWTGDLCYWFTCFFPRFPCFFKDLTKR